jgi:hypothetical protein
MSVMRTLGGIDAEAGEPGRADDLSREFVRQYTSSSRRHPGESIRSLVERDESDQRDAHHVTSDL